MKNQILVIAAILLFGFGLSAQDSMDSHKEFKHYIGLAAGATSGYGLSYQYSPNKAGVQFVFGGIKASDYSNLSAGVILKYDLIESNKASLFLFQSNSLFYSSYIYEDWDWDTGNSLGRTTERDYIINNGVGVGTDVSLGKRISLNVMGGVGSYNLFEIVTITGEIGVFYKL